MNNVNSNSSIMDSFVEVELEDDTAFLKIKETLTRIGIASKKENKLYQSCHILQKQGKYYIVSFKEMFMLDGKVSNFTEEDKARRNKIISLLKDWNLLKLKGEVNLKKIQSPLASMNTIKIISYKDKHNWDLESKYSIGNIRGRK
jgi:hypothetical protein